MVVKIDKAKERLQGRHITRGRRIYNSIDFIITRLVTILRNHKPQILNLLKGNSSPKTSWPLSKELWKRFSIAKVRERYDERERRKRILK